MKICFINIKYVSNGEKSTFANISKTAISSPLGFYRVNYDASLWNRIIAALHSEGMKDIHVSCRAQLIGDVFSMADDNLVSYNVAYALAKYVVNETEYEPWFLLNVNIKSLLETMNHYNQTEQAKALKVSNSTMKYFK